MAEEKVLQLKDLVELADRFQEGQITLEEFSAIGATMDIRAYIPILDKLRIATALSMKYMYFNSEINEVKVADLYKNLFFYGMLSTYAGVDCSEEELITYENYDKLFPLFYPFLISYCRDDYEILKEFVHDTLDAYTTQDFVDAMNAVSPESLEKAAEDNKKLLSELENNKDLIRDLKEIAAFNNPAAELLMNEVRELAAENAKKQK